MRSNCFFYAVGKYLKHGGYIAIRKCKHHKFCIHWLWSPDLKNWEAYTTDNDWELQWWQKLYYKGYVKKGDE